MAHADFAAVVRIGGPELGSGEEEGARLGVHPLLWHEGRARLLDFIESNAGICETELSVRAGIDRNTAKYHLKRLLRAGLIAKRREGRRVHFFPRNMPFLELQKAVAGARGETRRRILYLIHEKPEMSWRAVGRQLGITARAVRWHLEKLETAKLIQIDRTSAHRKVHLSPVLEAVLRGDPALLSGDELPKNLRGPEAFRKNLAIKPWKPQETRQLDVEHGPDAA